MQYKLCKVKRVQTGPKGIPFLTTHDARTIRYPDPLIKVNDTIQLDIATSKITDYIRFDSGKTPNSFTIDQVLQLMKSYFFSHWWRRMKNIIGFCPDLNDYINNWYFWMKMKLKYNERLKMCRSNHDTHLLGVNITWHKCGS